MLTPQTLQVSIFKKATTAVKEPRTPTTPKRKSSVKHSPNRSTRGSFALNTSSTSNDGEDSTQLNGLLVTRQMSLIENRKSSFNPKNSILLRDNSSLPEQKASIGPTDASEDPPATDRSRTDEPAAMNNAVTEQLKPSDVATIDNDSEKKDDKRNVNDSIADQDSNTSIDSERNDLRAAKQPVASRFKKGLQQNGNGLNTMHRVREKLKIGTLLASTIRRDSVNSPSMMQVVVAIPSFTDIDSGMQQWVQSFNGL